MRRTMNAPVMKAPMYSTVLIQYSYTSYSTCVWHMSELINGIDVMVGNLTYCPRCTRPMNEYEHEYTVNLYGVHTRTIQNIIKTPVDINQ